MFSNGRLLDGPQRAARISLYKPYITHLTRRFKGSPHLCVPVLLFQRLSSNLSWSPQTLPLSRRRPSGKRLPRLPVSILLQVRWSARFQANWSTSDQELRSGLTRLRCRERSLRRSDAMPLAGWRDGVPGYERGPKGNLRACLAAGRIMPPPQAFHACGFLRQGWPGLSPRRICSSQRRSLARDAR